MDKKHIILLFVGLFFFGIALSQKKDNLNSEIQYFDVGNGVSYGYTKPKFFDILTNQPQNMVDFGSFLIQKENILWTGMALGSTAALIPVDQKLLDNAQEIGEPWGLADDVRYIRVLGVELIPQDINGAIYYLGYGLVPMFISAGLYTSGKINNDYRAINTASVLMEVLLTSGVVVQVMKRTTGRESPSAAIENGNPGGHWTPFPSFKAYQDHTPSYDAMPSGHVTTLMATITVLATNYPEKKWIKPVGYSLMGVLGFQMMSSRVHWVSDYPLAILIGYAIGKNASNRRITKKIDDSVGERKTTFETNYSFSKIGDINVVGVSITF
ncbi:phosphatase PAP2 family protein [Ulvibacter antarcticus]|uniref:PAP2 superfamily protein n=1 Tax=Ulvibacter antarcticus TaxID=442714 RepID=A0A3L9YEZ8_9FLAO|nr:phosphatase PAP2 family protein [Ulvibacter antarcticus]RMA57930.1 PAP2 superfamily protein [Ulvibacter antarcticus]